MSEFDHTSTRTEWDRHVVPEHLRQMAQHVWGDDVQAMMCDHEPSEGLLMTYQHAIVDCEAALRGRRVLDMGCNHGLYSYLAMRHGASHVVGVEPRGMFVDGMNSFAAQHGFPMEFHRGYDTDLSRLLHKHDIDTVVMTNMETVADWENMLYDIRRSRVEWLIVQLVAIPDEWVKFEQQLQKMCETWQNPPAGFTLHFRGHNTDTRSPINPLHKDRADPDTGYQHIGPDGELDHSASSVFWNMRSRRYTRKFIEHAGFTVEHVTVQSAPLDNSPSISATNGLRTWYLLRNTK